MQPIFTLEILVPRPPRRIAPVDVVALAQQGAAAGVAGGGAGGGERAGKHVVLGEVLAFIGRFRGGTSRQNGRQDGEQRQSNTTGKAGHKGSGWEQQQALSAKNENPYQGQIAPVIG
ncbi:hypothetical protein G6F22_019254 [Rhizopus arrhizus]|nr:hypothetical protein G6F22_019254 [Rhizopus arrhizus]